MKKYLALLLAVMLVFSCALPAVSAVTPSDNVELTEDTSSEPEGFADPSSEPTPVNPCAHENKEFVEAQEPTCTDTGNVAYYHCPDCGCNLDENGNVIEDITIATISHVPGSEMYDADYVPCLGGYKTDYYYCINCGRAVDSDGNILERYPVDPNKHTPGGKNYGADYKPCRGGSVVDYYECTLCGQKLNARGMSLYQSPFERDPSGDHTLEAIPAKAPTYTEDGNKAYWLCSICKKAFSDEAGENEITDMSTVVLPKLSGKHPDGWEQKNSEWYYYENGTAVTDWKMIGGVWYYFDASGIMQTGWQWITGDWYFFNPSGNMQVGWKQINGDWYYFYDNGHMVSNDTLNIGGTRYTFDASGRWITETPKNGWESESGIWYFYENNTKANGWKFIGGIWYFFNSSGAMQTGWQSIGGVWYFFNSSGAMQTGWQSIGGVWYFFNSSGAMQTGWQSIGGVWYFFNSSGAMQTGWQSIGGVWYYFYNDGHMASKDNETAANGAHNWKVISNTATCESDGIKTEKCTVCGKTQTSKSEKTGHDFATMTGVEALQYTEEHDDLVLNGAYHVGYDNLVCDICKNCLCITNVRLATTGMAAAQEMLGYVNSLRESVYGTDEYNLVLDELCVNHALLRAEQISNYFEHYNTDPYNCQASGENILGGTPSVYSQYLQWYNSPGHYNNMISKEFTNFGYGAYISPDEANLGGGTFGVQTFTKP